VTGKERREAVLIRDGFRCRRCGKRATQTAHRIAQTKTWVRKYGRKVIDHPMNLVSVCSLACNDSFNIGNKPEEREALVKEIKEAIEHEHNR